MCVPVLAVRRNTFPCAIRLTGSVTASPIRRPLYRSSSTRALIRFELACPSSAPVYSITALVIALAFVILGGYCRYVFVWTPLERHYLREYFLTSLMARLGAKTDQQDILVVVSPGKATAPARRSMSEFTASCNPAEESKSRNTG